jgi:hypothetical protein
VGGPCSRRVRSAFSGSRPWCSSSRRASARRSRDSTRIRAANPRRLPDSSSGLPRNAEGVASYDGSLPGIDEGGSKRSDCRDLRGASAVLDVTRDDRDRSKGRGLPCFFSSRRPPGEGGRPRPVLTRARGFQRPLIAVLPSPRRTSRGPRGLTPLPQEVSRRRGGLLSLPEGFASLPEGFASLPEGGVTPTIPTEIGKETTPPSRRGRASLTISTRRGRLARQRRRIRTERRREARPPAPIGSKILTLEEPRAPRLRPPVRVMHPSGSRSAPSRRVTSRSGTRRSNIGRPTSRESSRGSSPRARAVHHVTSFRQGTRRCSCWAHPSVDSSGSGPPRSREMSPRSPHR